MKKLILNQFQDISGVFKKRNPRVINFLNSHDLYQFHNNQEFNNTFNEDNFNFIDGFILTFFLSIKKLRIIQRLSGPDFIKMFFENKLMKNKKHLFIGSEEEHLEVLLKNFSYLRRKDLFSYNPPYVKGNEFPEKEIKKMNSLINSKKIDFVWIGLGCPKQNILTARLISESKAKSYINIGAGLDFIIGKKKRAPKFFRKLGIEWLYRLITDFNHTKKKAWRSFVAFKYLKEVDLQ